MTTTKFKQCKICGEATKQKNNICMKCKGVKK